MHAKVGTATIVPGKTDELVEALRGVVIPAYEGLPGFSGALALVEPEGGKAMMITLWDSPESLRASEQHTGHRAVLEGLRRPTELAFYEVVHRI